MSAKHSSNSSTRSKGRRAKVTKPHPAKLVRTRAEKIGPGRVNWELINSQTEADILDTSPSELADLPADFWDRAVRMPPMIKAPISIRIDTDVLAWFREQGPRYQSRMNAVLRAYMESRRRR